MQIVYILSQTMSLAFSNLKSRKVKRKREEEQLNALGAKVWCTQESGFLIN